MHTHTPLKTDFAVAAQRSYTNQLSVSPAPRADPGVNARSLRLVATGSSCLLGGIERHSSDCQGGRMMVLDYGDRRRTGEPARFGHPLLDCAVVQVDSVR